MRDGPAATAAAIGAAWVQLHHDLWQQHLCVDSNPQFIPCMLLLEKPAAVAEDVMKERLAEDFTDGWPIAVMHHLFHDHAVKS